MLVSSWELNNPNQTEHKIKCPSLITPIGTLCRSQPITAFKVKSRGLFASLFDTSQIENIIRLVMKNYLEKRKRSTKRFSPDKRIEPSTRHNYNLSPLPCALDLLNSAFDPFDLLFIYLHDDQNVDRFLFFFLLIFNIIYKSFRRCCRLKDAVRKNICRLATDKIVPADRKAFEKKFTETLERADRLIEEVAAMPYVSFNSLFPTLYVLEAQYNAVQQKFIDVLKCTMKLDRNDDDFVEKDDDLCSRILSFICFFCTRNRAPYTS